jgi:hypothetical protein
MEELIDLTTEDIELEEVELSEEDQFNRLATLMRFNRTKLLADTDWTVLVDAPLTEEQKQQWLEYRAALRDIPEQEGFPFYVTLPEKP